MPDYRGWEIVRRLGEGGQGEVFLVRNPGRAKARAEGLKEIVRKVVRLNGIAMAGEHENTARELAETLAEYTRPDSSDELGALKQFKIPEGDQGKHALERFDKEVKALEMLKGEDGILRIIDVGDYENWIITEYHAGGTLAQHPDRFKGNPCAALAALKPVMAALAKLHVKGIVHRDVKPQNIFIDKNSRLVLGDFGIVFLQSDHRPTELLERVGSRDWMAPWAHTGMRVDDVTPNFDVFPLGKVLWSLISGRPMLPFWYHRKPENDLTKLFPNDPTMHLINSILDKCVVEQAENCLESAGKLLSMVGQYTEMLERGGQLLDDGIPRPCRICGIGTYRIEPHGITLIEKHPGLTAKVYTCDHCGNVQLFAPPSQPQTRTI